MYLLLRALQNDDGSVSQSYTWRQYNDTILYNTLSFHWFGGIRLTSLNLRTNATTLPYVTQIKETNIGVSRLENW